jgi:AraC-like DNA-binding protein
MTSIAELCSLASPHGGRIYPYLPRLQVYRYDEVTGAGGLIYRPVACLVLQGAKRTYIGNEILAYGAGSCMVVAAEISAIGQISQATPEEPYLAINLYLDPAVISALLLEMSDMPEPPLGKGYGLSEAGPALLDAFGRLVALLDHPEEVPVMANHLERELMFRLLMGPQGGLLRQIAGADSRLSHIRRAMAWIREHYSERLSIDAMATVAGMSVSVFHRRFKAVTGASPLQYQKEIRLHEARRQLVTERTEARRVGFAVGYESASQFSREYKRLFGASPRKDTERLQSAIDPTV